MSRFACAETTLNMRKVFVSRMNRLSVYIFRRQVAGQHIAPIQPRRIFQGFLIYDNTQGAFVIFDLQPRSDLEFIDLFLHTLDGGFRLRLGMFAQVQIPFFATCFNSSAFALTRNRQFRGANGIAPQYQTAFVMTYFANFFIKKFHLDCAVLQQFFNLRFCNRSDIVKPRRFQIRPLAALDHATITNKGYRGAAEAISGLAYL